MAKVNDLKKGLGSLKKKPIIAEERSEEIVGKIHKQNELEKKPKKRGRRKVNEENTIRYTIDIPESIYKTIKHKVVDEGVSMKSIVMRALKKELDLD